MRNAALLVAAVFTLALGWVTSSYYQLGSRSFGGFGFFFTTWGVAISLAGFGFTWFQLAKTRRTAAEVTRALGRVKNDYSYFDVVTEGRSAQAAANEAQVHINGDKWELALAAYSRIRGSLAKMLAVRNGLTPENHERAQDFLADAMTASQTLEGCVGVDAPAIDKGLLTGRLRELETFLIDVEFGTKDAFGGH
jgi:hypothetical protein